MGIDISSQRSRMLTPDLVQQADYIFGMTHSHVDTVMLLYPQAAEKTFLLREFDETLDTFEKDISDPIGGSYEVYLNCRDQIEQGIVSLLRFIEQSEGAAGGVAGKPATIAIGADHGGYELKEALKKYLEQRGLSVADFGANSQRIRRDYPDFAQAVGTARGGPQGALRRPDLHHRHGHEHRGQQGAGRARGAGERRADRRRWRGSTTTPTCSASPPKPRRRNWPTKSWTPFSTRTSKAAATSAASTKWKRNSSAATCGCKAVDPEIADAIEHERVRQQENIELIASENFTSPAVMEAQGSVLTNKYAEGYPKKRWYGGCENVDVVEQLAIDRAKKLFGAEHANVQPHSGSGATWPSISPCSSRATRC